MEPEVSNAVSDRATIILAAGKSTRMNSDLPKVLHEVCGRPMLAYALDAARDAGVDRLIVIVGYGKDDVISRFPDAGADSNVFPRHRVGIGGDSRTPQIYNVDLKRPMGSWQKAWGGACRKAGVRFRWHDLRHTFISRLAENPNVSEATIRSLAGHVSERMLQRYSHIRAQAKQAAIASLEQRSPQSGLITESRGSERPA